MPVRRWGGIEAGGTKIICALGRGPGQIDHQVRLETTTPEQTIDKILQFFQAHELPQALGIGSFGPVDVNPQSPTYGYLLQTPKPGWQQVDFLGALQRSLSIPMAINTDVNVVALAEARWGAAQGLDTIVYWTIGTGIGGGAIVNGQLLQGLLHPEMGHMSLRRSKLEPNLPEFAGACPFHGACLEGLASGTALRQRWGKSAEQLSPEHPAWELEADYLAQALVNVIYVLSPQRIILGGGVMAQGHLLGMIRQRVQTQLDGYLPGLVPEMSAYIVRPELGNEAGVLGAIALAQTIN